MIALIDAIEQYFIVKGWPISRHASLPIIRMEFATDHAECQMVVRVLPDVRQIIVYSLLAVVVPEAHRAAVIDFLTRANSALTIGNFELNFEDGQVRFRCGLDLRDGELTDGLFDPLVDASLVCIEDHAEAILSVASGRAIPAEAIQAIWDDVASIDFHFRGPE